MTPLIASSFLFVIGILLILIGWSMTDFPEDSFKGRGRILIWAGAIHIAPIFVYLWTMVIVG